MNKGNKQVDTSLVIADLISAYLNGSLDTEGLSVLSAWIQEDAHNRTLFEQICNGDNLDAIHAKIGSYDTDLALSRVKVKASTPVPVYTLWRRIAAAVVLMVLGLGLFFWTRSGPSLEDQARMNHIVPGGNKAYLTLADGKSISLEEAAKGKVAVQGGVVVTKSADGQIIYSVSGSSGILNPNQLNTMTTPKGGVWQLRLPDGTVVWLNAASSLVYPVSFKGSMIREVELKGEAYFEVAKDRRHPFVVKTALQRVEVLGTHFNVSAYGDDPDSRTTLLEGAVRVNDKVVLKPAQQAVAVPHELRVVAVDAAVYTGWKDGIFTFRNERLGAVLRKLARWYDVEVEYTERAGEIRTYSGTVSRSDQISGVLNLLRESEGIRFSIVGRKVIVEGNE